MTLALRALATVRSKAVDPLMLIHYLLFTSLLLCEFVYGCPCFGECHF